MNPFLLYLVMKLDDIVFMSSALMLVAAFVWAGCWTVRGMNIDFEGESPCLLYAARKALIVAIVSCAVALVTPSTKQVAAIYVLHHLTTGQTLATIERESGELYGLFKAWLRTEIEDAPSDPAPKDAP
jgi:hypothetical protein